MDILDHNVYKVAYCASRGRLVDLAVLSILEDLNDVSMFESLKSKNLADYSLASSVGIFLQEVISNYFYRNVLAGLYSLTEVDFGGITFTQSVEKKVLPIEDRLRRIHFRDRKSVV